MKIIKLFPGIVLSVAIAALACWLESLLPIHLIGSAVIAMFIGMFLNQFVHKTDVFASGLKFTSKKILKFAIILLGLSLNISTILHVGKMSLTVMVFTLLTCFGGGYFIGKALGLNWKLSNLISAGTGICGGSAIAAIAPTIDADDNDVAYAMSATFLFDMAMIVLFPIMGRALGIRNFISLMFNYAIQNRILNYNPVQGVKLPKQPYQPARALTVEEQKRLETAARESERLLMFAIILDLYTGLRKGELLGLQWTDINFAKGCISITKQLARHHSKDDSSHPYILDIVPPKTEASIRKVYMINDLKNELLSYRVKSIAWKEAHGYQHSEEDFLFFSRKNTPIEPRRFHQYYQELLEIADIEDATFHTLRHTFATRCLEAGIDIVTVSKLLGHADSRVTANTYSHLLPEYHKKEIKKISKLFRI